MLEYGRRRKEERIVVQIEVQKIVEAWQEPPPPPPALARLVVCPWPSTNPDFLLSAGGDEESAGRSPRIRPPTLHPMILLRVASFKAFLLLSNSFWSQTFVLAVHRPCLLEFTSSPLRNRVCPYNSTSFFLFYLLIISCSLLFKQLLPENRVELCKTLQSSTDNWIYDYCRPLKSPSTSPNACTEQDKVIANNNNHINTCLLGKIRLRKNVSIRLRQTCNAK